MSDQALVVMPSFAPVLSLVTDSVRSPHTRRAYRSALTEFLLWCHAAGPATFSKAAVQEYRTTLEQRHLSASSIQVQMSAIRRLAAEMADNGLLDPQTALVIAKVRSPHRHGVRLGNWLSLRQAEDLLALPDAHRLKGKRDRAALCVLLGARAAAGGTLRAEVRSPTTAGGPLGDCRFGGEARSDPHRAGARLVQSRD